MHRVGATSCLSVVAGLAIGATPASAETFMYMAPTFSEPTPFKPAVVPAGMRFASVDMYGAQGSGKGARVTAIISVTPGETLRVYVGGAPSAAEPSLMGQGYNGGGFPALPGGQGGGGGASDIRRTADLGSRVVVAGGGGGTGGAGLGGDSGKNGANGGSGLGDGKGGASGSNGGAGGAGGQAPPFDPSNPGVFGLPGSPGGAGAPGVGGSAASSAFPPGPGAGGGGLMGGGGGGGGAFIIIPGPSGGGGGGSSLAPRGTVTDGVRSGNGEVTITYSATDPAPPASSPGLTPSGTADTVKPSLGALGLSRSAFAAAPSGASTSAKRRRKKAPVGTKVSYSLSEAATVRFTVQLKAAGRKSGKKCGKPTRKNRRKAKCTRWVKVSGSFAHSGKAGANRFTFRGRVSGKKLRPGSYRLNGTAKDAAGNSSPVRQKAFRIVK